MLRRPRSNKAVDLTPLLDVVLILLFALLLNMSAEQDTYKAKASDLDEQLGQVNVEKAELEQLLNDANVQVYELQTDLETMSEQSEVIDEAIVTWLTNEDIRNKELMTSTEIKGLFEKDKTNQSLYKMNYIANQFFFIDISFNTEELHQVIINDIDTNVQLTIEKRNNQEQLKIAYDAIYDAVEKEMTSKKGGYSYILFTLKDNGKVNRYAYDFVWGILKDIELKEKDNNIYKLKYFNY